jgi:hypothetical protein
MKVEALTSCPGCNKNHLVSLDLGNIPEAKAINMIGDGQQQVKEVIKPVQLSWMPNQFCSDGKCTVSHNKDTYAQRVTKRCANGDCGQFAPKAAAKCAWCGSKGIEDVESRFDELTDEELDEIGVPKPEAHSHEGHNHD